MRAMTENRPKCLVEFAGRPLLEWQLAALRTVGVDDVTLVVGYQAAALEGYGSQRVENPRWAETNMVYSLMCARDVLTSGTGVLIGYSDLMYEPRLLATLCASPGDVATVIDENWRLLWESRFNDPLADAETLKRRHDGSLYEIGRKPRDYSEIEGQFVGLTRLSAAGAQRFVETWESVRSGQNPPFGNRSAETCHFTDMLQRLIDLNFPVMAAPVRGGWLEFDSDTDFALYDRWRATGKLGEFFEVW